MSDYKSYSPSKAASQAYRTKTPPKYADHRDVDYNTTLSPYKTSSSPFKKVQSPYRTPLRDTLSRTLDDIILAENLSASKILLENEVRNIYKTEIDLQRSILQDNQLRRDIIDLENERLAREVEYWRGKSSTADISRLSHLLATSSNLRLHELNQIRSTVEAQNYSLRLEADRLRDLLVSKVEQCQEIKSNYSKLELSNASNPDRNDDVAQDYQTRIDMYKEEYEQKLKEVQDLKDHRIKLEMDNLELKKAQREADKLKTLIEAKEDENQRIRRKKLEIELENEKNKQNESVLTQKEAELKAQLESLKLEEEQTYESRKSAYQEKTQNQSQDLNELRKSYYEEQSALEKELQDQLQNALDKSSEVDSMKRSYHSLTANLQSTELEANQADSELELWKERVAQADRLREEDIARAERLKEESIKLAASKNLQEKQLLESKVNTFDESVQRKESELERIAREAAQTEEENKLLEDERTRLQKQVDDLVQRQEEKEQIFQYQLKSRNNLQSSSLERVRREHDNEKRRISNQISALRNVIDAKRDEADRARREAGSFCLKLVNCENKALTAEIESNYWRDQTDRATREKDLEQQIQKNVTDQQLRSLETIQEIDRLNGQSKETALRSVINSRSREASDMRYSQARTASQVARERQERLRLETEVEINKHRALEAERRKLTELRVRDTIHNDTVSSMRNSGLTESVVLRSEVGYLNDTLIKKDLEAREWKNNYSRLASSPYSPSKKY